MTRRVELAVRVTPRAAADAVGDVDEHGTLRVRVRAAPVDGAANDALIRLLAAELALPRRDVRLVRGGSSRRKRVALHGVEADALRARWPGLRIGPP